MKVVSTAVAFKSTIQGVQSKVFGFPFKNRFVEIEGHQIHYVDEGQGDILLFSHAAIGSSYMYRKLIQQLREHFRCIAFDYPDFGLSLAKPGYGASVRNQARIISAFVQKLDLKQLIILGHDTGGPSAFFAAQDWPSRVAGFILTDTLVFPVDEYSRIARMLRILDTSAIYWLNRKTNFLTRVTTKFGFFTKKLTKTERNIYLDSSRTARRRDQSLNMLVSLRKDVTLMNEVAHGFSTTWKKTPCLLMYGEKDPVNVLGIPDRLNQELDQSTVRIIQDEGHFPHEGKWQEMSKEIISWWNQHSVK